MRYLFLTILVLFSIPGFATIWKVSISGKYRSIQQVIDLAKPGDTIYVSQGVYREHTITINKKLFVSGIGMPVLDGEKKYEIVAIKADGVVLEGFHVKHGGYSSFNDIAAIKIHNSRDVVIRNNKIDDTFFGIYSLHGTRCTIENNHLSSTAINELQSANGIHCWKSDSMIIRNNTITGHRDGIYFEFVTNSLVKGNISYGNVRYGLHFMFSHSDTYENNTFKNNGAGVAVMYTRQVRMTNNTFSDNWGSAAYGLLLKEITDSHIEGNRFENNTSGIYMEGSSRIRIMKNLFRNNGWGLKIQASCDNNSLSGNNFISNTFDVATNGSNSLNSYENNYWDKYDGYDLNRNGIGDIPFRPVSLYSMIVERNPPAMMLFRSFMVTLLDKAEKVIPSLTPLNLVDEKPLMKPAKL